MKFLENLTKKTQRLQRSIGFNYEQLNLLVTKLEPLWEKAELERKGREGRKRRIGGGRVYKLKLLEHKVITFLLYYKLYVTQEFLGIIVDIDQANIARLIKKIAPLIEQAADPTLAKYLTQAKSECSGESKRINDWQEFLKRYPDLRDVSIDATEQKCFRSQDYKTQKNHYSGKKKQHSLKTQITVSATGRILDVSQTYPGSVHDKTILDQEKTPKKFPRKTAQRYDLGYQGIVQEYPEHYIILPHKKPRGDELSSLAKELNQMHNRRRVVAENALSRVKKFRICAEQYRGLTAHYNQMFRGVAALINFKLATS
jgi:hypothetical protein